MRVPVQSGTRWIRVSTMTRMPDGRLHQSKGRVRGPQPLDTDDDDDDGLLRKDRIWLQSRSTRVISQNKIFGIYS
jgi:hypothetical protein